MLRGEAEVGRKVAVIGAGGIGFDVSEYLLGEKARETPPERRIEDIPSFLKVMFGLQRTEEHELDVVVRDAQERGFIVLFSAAQNAEPTVRHCFFLYNIYVELTT